MGRSDFDALKRVWQHSTLSRQAKVRLFNAVVVSKVLYGFSSLWMNKMDRCRLDGWQAKCLRCICNIPHSSISRVSNKDVLLRAGCQPLTRTLLMQQLRLYGRIASQGGSSILYQDAFNHGSVLPRVSFGRKPMGRPRNLWAQCLHLEVLKIMGNQNAIDSLFQNDGATETWPGILTNYFSSAI